MFRHLLRKLAILIALSVAVQSYGKPLNVVLIVVDDLGWSDLACCGSDFYETPQIDRFAARSLRFTKAYAAAPVCSPTRAALMTGKDPARLDMTIWHEGAVDGGPRDRRLLPASSVANLPLNETTLAELFKSAGYTTAHIGKWHLGTAAFYPETQGFDFNIGGTFWGAPSTFFFPFAGKWNARDPQHRYVPGLSPSKPGDYLTDRLTDKAIDIMQQVEQPFFINLCFYSVHSPIEAPKETVRHFTQKQPGKRHRDPTYAAMVKRMDYNVGRVLDWLDQRKLMSETIVVITSDNGGVDFDQRGIVPTSNAPLRSGKGTLYEGGLRVPLLIHWPGVTTGGECDEMVTTQDFVPSFVEYLSTAPNQFDLPESRPDGISLLPVLKNPHAELDRDSLFWHFPHYYPRMTPASAIRQDDWKLIHYYEDDRVELYDLATDPGEQDDMSARKPTKAAELKAALDAWRANVGANEPTVR